MKVYVINGYPRSGKDSFVEFCSYSAMCACMSTVDKIKKALLTMGWDGRKTPEARQRLSDLKDMATKWYDGPFRAAQKSVHDAESRGMDAIFIHCREPNEIQRIKDELGAETILIDRAVCRAADNDIYNHADTFVMEYEYDHIIDNNGTITELMMKANEFVKEEILCCSKTPSTK